MTSIYILCPQERDAEARKKFYAWISAMDPSADFPIRNKMNYSSALSLSVKV